MFLKEVELKIHMLETKTYLHIKVIVRKKIKKNI